MSDSKLQKTELPPDPSGCNGLFSHIRQSNSGSKISDLIKVTASSTYYGTPENILDWSTSDFWQSQNDPGQWIDLDLNGRLFILKSIAFKVYNKNFPRKWHLSVFDSSGVESVVFENVSDQTLNSDNTPVVISIPNLTPFSRFRIVADDQNFNNNNYFVLRSIEFFGTLFSKPQ
jgi:hypothetical protein